MKKLWFVAAGVLILVMLLLRSRYSEFYRVDENGYAVKAESVSTYLYSEGEEAEELADTTIDLYSFSENDEIYKRGSKFYFGEDEKTEIDLTYPLFVNGGAGLRFTKDAGSLYDVNFEIYKVYDHLTVVEGVSYNHSGERADAMNFNFYKTSNGQFFNLAPMTYSSGSTKRVIDANSLIFFDENYMNYLEVKDGQFLTKRINGTNPNATIEINNTTMTYHDMLVNIGIINVAREKAEKKIALDKEKSESENKGSGSKTNGDKKDSDGDISDEEGKDGLGTDGTDGAQSGQTATKTEKTGGSGTTATSKGGSGSGGAGGTDNSVSRGVNPDRLKGDGQSGGGGVGGKKYVKPTVTFEKTDVTYGIYYINLPVNVKDSASRITGRGITFEVYEVNDSGETIAERAYAKSTKTLEIGKGAIKPGKTYRIKAFYSYNNEKDEAVAVDLTGDDYFVTVNDLPAAADRIIYLKSGPMESDASKSYLSIPYYFDTYMKLFNVQVDMENTDSELLYGIKEGYEGIEITVSDNATYNAGLQSNIVTKIDASTVKQLKSGICVNLQTAQTLEVNHQNYYYYITAKDYFGNAFKVVSDTCPEIVTGTFDTCKTTRPVASLKISDKSLGHLSLNVSLNDTENTLVYESGQEPEVYVLASSIKYTEYGSKTDFWSAINNKYTGGVCNTIPYIHRFSTSDPEMTFATDHYVISGWKEDIGIYLEQDTTYYFYLVANYDLNNGYGPIKSIEDTFDDILDNKSTKTVGLDSLGNVFISAQVSKIYSDNATLTLSLNKDRTLQEITKILSRVEVEFYEAGDSDNTLMALDPITFTLTNNDLDAFTGYEHEIVNNKIALKTDINGDPVEIQKSNLTRLISGLTSVTSYRIKLTAYGIYNGTESTIPVTMTAGTFKTTKTPAYIDVKNPLLVGGTFYFDIAVVDPDAAKINEDGSYNDTIVGSDPELVYMFLYSSNNQLVKRELIQKVRSLDEGYTTFVVTGLEPGLKYYMNIVAEVYNEGYTDATKKSNVRIGRYEENNPIDLTGTIELNDIEVYTSTEMNATVNVKINDNDTAMTGLPYSVKITRRALDQVGAEPKDVTNRYNKSQTTVYPTADDGDDGGYIVTKTAVEGSIKGLTTYSNQKEYIVTKGKYEYVFTLQVTLRKRLLTLDTLSFTSEAVVRNIGIDGNRDPVDVFIEQIQAHPKDKFAVTCDLDFGSTRTTANKELFTPEGKAKYTIVTSFDGQIDFQGHKIRVHREGSTVTGPLFTNLTQNAEIYNAVFDYSTGYKTPMGTMLASYNYGYVHDIYLNYLGGAYMIQTDKNAFIYSNAASGRIENFVVNNCNDGCVTDDNGKLTYPFCATNSSGILCNSNYGVIKNGYAYGQPITTMASINGSGSTSKSATTYKTTSATQYYNNCRSKMVAAICSRMYTGGSIENVYSTVNTIIPATDAMYSPTGTNTNACIYQGSLVAYIYGGTLKNCYVYGQNYLGRIDQSDDKTYNNGTQAGYIITNEYLSSGNPLSYCNSATRYGNNFYYNKEDVALSNQTLAKKTTVHCMRDDEWQKNVLGDAFNTDVVKMGYFPTVKLNSVMPEQPLIALPEDKSGSSVSVASIIVLEEDEKAETAKLQIRLKNSIRATITKINVDNAQLTIDENQGTADGYTTLICTISKPTAYYSSYAISSVVYRYNNMEHTETYTTKPLIYTEFYRSIKTPAEWFNYVMKKTDQNYRIDADITFENISYSRIAFSTFSGKMKGGEKKNSENGFDHYGLYNITIARNNTSGYNCVINTLSGTISDLYIENLTLNTGTLNRDRNGFIGVLSASGYMDNVHIKNETIIGANYIGGFMGTANAGSRLFNCSITNLNITYKEASNSNTTAYVGGLAGYITNSNIFNCFVRGLNMKVIDAQVSKGVGGAVGYSYYSRLDAVEVIGEMDTRTLYTGGVIGYHRGNKIENRVTNLISLVNMKVSQDYAGGLIGAIELADALQSGSENSTGMAFGNINCTNTSLENISFTLGYYVTSNKVHFYGTEYQNMTKMGKKAGLEDDPNTTGILTEAQMYMEESYTAVALGNMDQVYNYSYAELGYMPKLYEYGSTAKELPFQTENIAFDPNVGLVDDGDFVITSINSPRVLGDGSYEITMNIEGPKDATITDLDVEYLVYQSPSPTVSSSPAADASKAGYYLTIVASKENDQKRFFDNYRILGLTYKLNGKEKKADFSEKNYKIELQMFANIGSLSEWNKYINSDNNYGNYENYRIVDDINFGTGVVYTKNAKIGRLVGRDITDKATGQVRCPNLSGINIGDANTNFIFRLNSELANLRFYNCTIKSRGRDVAGLIGTCSAYVYDVEFDEVTIYDTQKKSKIGIIGAQDGGQLGSTTDGPIILNRVTIGTKDYPSNYIGGLVGYNTAKTLYQNIQAYGVKVYGTSYVGGIVGYAMQASFDNILIDGGSDTADTTNHFYVYGTSYVGGIAGVQVGGPNGSYNSRQMISGVHASATTNVTVNGTRFDSNYDYFNNDEGVAKGTTREIKVKSTVMVEGKGQSVGGLFGRNWGYFVGAYASDDAWTQWGMGAQVYGINHAAPININGIAVTSPGNRLGGLIGDGGYVIYNVTMTDSFVGNTAANAPTTDTANTYVGGIVGYHGAGSGGGCLGECKVDDCDIATINVSYVGGIGGYLYGDSECLFFENSRLLAQNRMPTALVNYVGGIYGSNTYRFYNLVSRNNKIDGYNNYTRDMTTGKVYELRNPDTEISNYSVRCQYTGGICGADGSGYWHANQSAMVWGTPINTDADGNEDDDVGASIADYYVRGENKVGGITGHARNYVQYCSTNINVIAMGYYAGGIAGQYSNEKNEYNGVWYNTSAGYVRAYNYAGGIFGRISSFDENATEFTTACFVGRNTSKNSDGTYGYPGAKLTTYRSNTSIESEKTYGNIIWNTEIKTYGGYDCYAFAGNCDGFEGMANQYNQTTYKDTVNNLPLDRAVRYTAARTIMYEGTKLTTPSTSKYLWEITNKESGDDGLYPASKVSKIWWTVDPADGKYITTPVWSLNGNTTGAIYDDYYKDMRGYMKPVVSNEAHLSEGTNAYKYMLFNGGYLNCEFGTDKVVSDADKLSWKCGAYRSQPCEYYVRVGGVRLVSQEMYTTYSCLLNNMAIVSHNIDYDNQYKKDAKTGVISYWNVSNNQTTTNLSNWFWGNTTEWFFDENGTIVTVRGKAINSYSGGGTLVDVQGTWAQKSVTFADKPFEWVLYDDTSPYRSYKTDANRIRYFYVGPSTLPIAASAGTATNYVNYSYYNNYFKNNPLYIPVTNSGARPTEDMYLVPNMVEANGAGASVEEMVGKGTIYASDVDKINIEFTEELVANGGYFRLYRGNQLIDEVDITKRIYTYDFDFSNNLSLEYGYMDENGNPVFKNAEEPEIFSIFDMTHRVMVYDTNGQPAYYYISDDGIVYGRSGEEEAGQDSESTTENVYEETILSGRSFVNLMKGKALSEDGFVYDVVTGERLGEAGGISARDEVTPLEEVIYNGATVRTFAWCSIVDESGSPIIIDRQILASTNGTTDIIAENLENIKTTANLFTAKSGLTHVILLGEDGHLADVHLNVLNAPEDFVNRTIVDMSSNYQSTGGYILVEYDNGAIYGYNFYTGKTLTAYGQPETQSLMEFFLEDYGITNDSGSSLGNAYRSYSSASDVAGLAVNPTGMEILVTGNSTGKKVKGNNSEGIVTGNDYSGNQELASDGKKASEDTELRDSANQADSSEDITSEEEIEQVGEYVNGTATAGDDAAGLPDTDPMAETETEPVEGESTEDAVASEPEMIKSAAAENIPVVETPELVTMYNADTKQYEVVSVDYMLSDSNYVSENDRLGVSDLSKYSSYKATNQEDENPMKGIWLYILVAVGIAAGLGAFGFLRKKSAKGDR